MDVDQRRLKKFSKRIYETIREIWPSSELKFSANVTIKHHQEVESPNKDSIQWNIFGDFGTLNVSASGIEIGVLDTGVTSHPSLINSLGSGVDLISEPISANDGDSRDMNPFDPGDFLPVDEDCPDGSSGANSSSWHGTHVTGIISMIDSQRNLTGVASGVMISPIRVLGSCGGSLEDVVDGVLWASGEKVRDVSTREKPVDVLNLSLGGYGKCPVVFQEALNIAYDKDIIVVVSAGNSGLNLSVHDVFPANCDGVISVASTDNYGEITYYSNFNGKNTVFAPGGTYWAGIYSTINLGDKIPEEHGFAEMSGTSMAAPHVTGIIAGLITERPDLERSDLKKRMINHYKNSYEVINFNNALAYIDNEREEQKEVRELGSSGGSTGGHMEQMGGGCARVDLEPSASKNMFFSFVLNYLIFLVVRRIQYTIQWKLLV